MHTLSATAPEPVCGGFDHCSSYNDGCNECFCSDSREVCTEMACLVQGKPFCISCQSMYALNEVTKECEACEPPPCQDPCGPFDGMAALGQVVCDGHPDAYCRGSVDCDGCFATFYDGDGTEIECKMTYPEPVKASTGWYSECTLFL